MKRLLIYMILFLSIGIFAGDNYQKIIINEAGDYKIKYIPENGKEQIISENQDLFTKWKREGNSPEVIPYVIPPPIPPVTIDQKINIVLRKISKKQNESYDSGFVFNGKNFPSDLQYREFMATGVRLAKEAIENNQDISIKAFTATGEEVVLSAQNLLDLQRTYDVFCLNVYSLFMQEMLKMKTATEADLDYYIANGKFE